MTDREEAGRSLLRRDDLVVGGRSRDGTVWYGGNTTGYNKRNRFRWIIMCSLAWVVSQRASPTQNTHIYVYIDIYNEDIICICVCMSLHIHVYICIHSSNRIIIICAYHNVMQTWCVTYVATLFLLFSPSLFSQLSGAVCMEPYHQQPHYTNQATAPLCNP